MKKKIVLSILFLVFTSIFIIRPFFIHGFFPMHDDTQVARVFEMGKSLRDGMFPVRWVADLGYGYGYPLFNFYAPFAYYIGGIFTLLGFDALIATKIMMIFGIVLSGVSMYLLAREFFGETGGVTAGLFYFYAPYHALDIYVRGDVAEFYAYAFIPLVFLGFYKLFQVIQFEISSASSEKIKTQKNIWKWIIISSLSYAGVILSHNLTAMMITPYLLLTIIILSTILYKNNKLFVIRYLLFSVFLGILISAFYWIPVFGEMQYTNVLSQIGGGADFRDHFVCITQLWQSPWGFAGSTTGCTDGISFKIGKFHILAVIFALSIFFFPKNKKLKNAMFLGVVFLLLSIFFLLPYSKPVWDVFPFMKFLQYPWRFLILTSFFSSFIAGALPFLFRKILMLVKTPKVEKYLFIIIFTFFIGIVGFLSVDFFIPQTIFKKSAEDYTSAYALKWTASRVSDEYMPQNFKKPTSSSEIVMEKIILQKGNVMPVLNTTKETRAVITSVSDTRGLLKTAYFPAWNLTLNNKKYELAKVNQGMTFFAPSGKHVFQASFEQTRLEIIANCLSLIGIAILFLGIIYGTKKEMT